MIFLNRKALSSEVGRAWNVYTSMLSTKIIVSFVVCVRLGPSSPHSICKYMTSLNLPTEIHNVRFASIDGMCVPLANVYLKLRGISYFRCLVLCENDIK